jgi:tetratricopeptide (TPR) repeat protein
MADHILAVEPSNTQGIQHKAFCFRALGNLEAVDLVLASPGAPLHLRAHQALNKHHATEAVDMFTKELKDARGDYKNEILLDLGLAQQRAGDSAASKAAYQQAVQELTQALNNIDKADPAHGAGLHSLLGVAYAGLGDAPRAVAEGQKGMALQPTSQDPLEGPEREEQMAQIYALLGNADEAIPILKKWIQVPSVTSITPTLLRIDPIWDPIRKDPGFQELLAGKELIGPNK